MYCGDDVSSVVIDMGSYQTRFGYSGEDCPRCVIPSMGGQISTEEIKQTEQSQKNPHEDVEMQDEEQKKTLSQSSIIQQKQKMIVGSTDISLERDNMHLMPLFQETGATNFDVMEEMLNHSLKQILMVDIKETPLLFSEPCLHNKENRMKLAEYMFEKHGVPALFLCKDAVLSAFACGRSTALVLDSAYKSTSATPVHEGYTLQKCVIKHDIGGNTLTEQLNKWLVEDKKVEVAPRFTFKRKFRSIEGEESFEITRLPANPHIHPSYYKWSQDAIVTDLKEQQLFVCEDTPTERNYDSIRSQPIELPDGTQLDIQKERISLTEQMFSQSDSLQGFTGIQNMVVESISKADIDIRRDLFQSVIVTGGNTMFKGFVDRLQRLVPEISPQNVRVKVIHSNDRRFSPWVGGSILSSLGSFQQMWMSRQEYEEHGAIMIERKCP